MKKIIPGLWLVAVLLTSCSGESEKNRQAGGTSAGESGPDTLSDGRSIQRIMKKNFGTVDGKDVFLYTLKNRNGYEVAVTNYGAIVTSILMPDKNDQLGDIVLGYDTVDSYIANSPYFGAIVGRYANRIAGARFTLEGQTYRLAANNGRNSLHGGRKGLDKVVWEAEAVTDNGLSAIRLSYLSPDGEEGYPGNLKVIVTYTLNDSNELITKIDARTDKPTPVNLCNHTYFNLGGKDAGILGHLLTIKADRYTEVGNDLIPTGRLLPVVNTPMDFTKPFPVGARINQVKGGYDHNYVLNKSSKVPEEVAILSDPVSGRQVIVLTTQPGIQFYSGNFLDGTIRGKNGIVYQKHHGLCLETQHFPDSPNQPAFPNTILRPGELFSETTVYRFSVHK